MKTIEQLETINYVAPTVDDIVALVNVMNDVALALNTLKLKEVYNSLDEEEKSNYSHPIICDCVIHNDDIETLFKTLYAIGFRSQVKVLDNPSVNDLSPIIRYEN